MISFVPRSGDTAAYGQGVTTPALAPRARADTNAGLAPRVAAHLPFATSATVHPRRADRRRRALLAAHCREVGVATEMLLTKEEQVSDDRACAAGLRLSENLTPGDRCRPTRRFGSRTAAG